MRPRRVLFKCQCGYEVLAALDKRHDPVRHPRHAEIEADFANQIPISEIRAKYNLSRNQASGRFSRFWKRVRERSAIQ